MDPQLSAENLIDLLGLEPLPVEGGHFRRTFADAHSTAIYYLLTPEGFSAMHRLSGAEVWHWYAGAPATMLLLEADGRWRRPVLGSDLLDGERPQVAVAPEVVMGAETQGAWTLLGTTMAPGFDDVSATFPGVAELVGRWPSASEHIRRLVR